MKKFTAINESFICENCGKLVAPLSNGSYRNHCPFCFYSKHLDNYPGDRMNNCHGLMSPHDFIQKNGVLKVIHKCTICGEKKVNKLALDDYNQPDDYDLILYLMKNKTLNGRIS
ncbi:hypothetical protein BHF71_09935 [Vulcanibacillus modesticaldus]|uniref:RNHCP domain-containing protein n=1 Tax=Vulcanibacillus modesticaldus TaxID=337097 RepID=A0A1D2YTJ5_9BACI|nr:RNHCP domain-containing protein [Vulcanibacillus modesticaldus]OEF98999.1 hypothetical protein BHF71_09935 [Vulcanibacillus modesticaldus]